MKKIILVIFITAVGLCGQSFDAVSLSMAGNYGALSRGVNALPFNPANLALPRGNSVEVNLFSINSAIYNNTLSLNKYNLYFTEEGHGGEWSESDKQDIIDFFADDGLNIYTDLSTNVLGLAVNNFGFAVQAVSQGKIHLLENTKPLEIMLYGETIDKAYAYADPAVFEGSMYSALKFSAGYAYPFSVKNLVPFLDQVYAGINLNYYMGLSVFESKKAEINAARQGEYMDDTTLEYRLEMEARTSIPNSGIAAGSGFGLDLGLTVPYEKKWHFSLSFNNLFAGINWDGENERHYLMESDSALAEDMFDDSLDTSVSEDSSYAIGAFSTPLPTVMRLAVAYNMMKNLTLTADWRQGLNTAFGNSTTPRVGVGAEYFAMKWLPLRLGLAVGGNHGYMFGLGFGLHLGFFKLDYSYAVNKAMWPTSSKGVFNALSMKLVF